ncbi:zinc ribbon domain-containing protein [Mammaliicoccus sciuri]|uniref:Putative regulatory protein, FmdB family n=1 Tax=Sporosarcina newyorkensis TaxID=759851 RepID=A0A1T4XDU8_9BACL|nr:zinc ribbon domain-containing protein [Sporosarcina newyorkensis]SKA87743.1 putative regulatory protein, FmdB family [Sporosarcina newyorkensis]
MPNYTFRCPGCGEFTLFFNSMSGNRENTECPTCKSEAARVYFAPHLFTLSRKLSSKIEKGMEPQRMTRDELGAKQKQTKVKANRPWQVG